jgi:hypothetical protein
MTRVTRDYHLQSHSLNPKSNSFSTHDAPEFIRAFFPSPLTYQEASTSILRTTISQITRVSPKHDLCSSPNLSLDTQFKNLGFSFKNRCCQRQFLLFKQIKKLNFYYELSLLYFLVLGHFYLLFVLKKIFFF